MPEVIQTVHKCTLEWDVDRGVLYVHNDQGQAILRICRLPNSRGIDLQSCPWQRKCQLSGTGYASG